MFAEITLVGGGTCFVRPQLLDCDSEEIDAFHRHELTPERTEAIKMKAANVCTWLMSLPGWRC